MKKLIILLFITAGLKTTAQELFVFSQPASNNPVKSLAFSMGARSFKMTHNEKYDAQRFEPQLQVGLHKNLMLQANLYASNMFQPKTQFEGGSIYAKWRFLTIDDVHKHFRMAAFSKYSLIKNETSLTTIDGQHTEVTPNGNIIVHDIYHTTVNYENELEGSNSGFAAGLVATQLLNKFAISGGLNYSYRLNNTNTVKEFIVPWQFANYNLSMGYLVHPTNYQNYKQTNINLYFELLGTNGLDKNMYALDLAPSIQFIFNSTSRLNIGHRFQVKSNMERMSNALVYLKFEYLLLNAFK
jgi:hypothetical protein